MSYIIKSTSGIINTRVTDLGRQRISEGNFNISFFQIGDSELNYNNISNYNHTNNNILMPAFNAQNDTGTPNSNKQNIKYPYYLNGYQGNTYGIPYQMSGFEEVYNTATPRGFFSGSTGQTILWTTQVTSAYTISSNFILDLYNCTGNTQLTILSASCSPTTGTPQIGDLMVIYYSGGSSGCGNINTNPILTYKLESVTSLGAGSYSVDIDRNSPDYTSLSLTQNTNFANVYIYPSGMTQLYDTITPLPFWQTDTLNFESPCDVINRENTLIWNMNVPWTENPAGLLTNTFIDYTQYESVTYIGTKELLGYMSSSGQIDTSEVFFYNSFDEKVVVTPEDQKAIAIIHYTNQDIDNVYGEKFGMIPFDPLQPFTGTGSATNFKLSLPTVMWHKSNTQNIGVDFYVDPPAKNNLSTVQIIKSRVNSDMNDPGIRYFHLWDNNLDSNNNLNRVGKVFPDQQIIVIDDEELVAAMSYKSNRNWTLPSPKLTLVAPNLCDPSVKGQQGIMTGDTQVLWVTYVLKDTNTYDYLHCNYYNKIYGPGTGCSVSSQNVLVSFGDEFKFMNGGFQYSNFTGFSANDFRVLCQLRNDNLRPDPSMWKVLDFTNKLSATTVNNYFTSSGFTITTFEISPAIYSAATTYNLSNYLSGLPAKGNNNKLNFGGEYFFYGNLATDISATIYEMKYNVILNNNQFVNTSNPTWITGSTSYISEIGLYNQEKELMIISKLQSPQMRQNIQQFVVKLDW